MHDPSAFRNRFWPACGARASYLNAVSFIGPALEHFLPAFRNGDNGQGK